MNNAKEAFYLLIISFEEKWRIKELHVSAQRRREMQAHEYMPLLAATFLLFGLNNTETSAMTEYVADLGGGAFLAGAQNSVYVLVAIVLRFFIGPLADRFGSKPLLLAGAAGFFIPCALLPLCDNLALVLVLRIVQAIGLAAFHPNVPNYFVEAAPKSAAPRWIGYARFAGTASLIVVPAVLFPVIGRFGYPVFFACLAAMGIVSAACVATLRATNPPESPRAASQDGREARSTLGSLWPYLSFLVAPFVMALGYSLVLFFGPSFIKAIDPSTNEGLLLTFVSIGGLAGNLAASQMRERWGFRATTGFMGLAFAGGLFMLSAAGFHLAIGFCGAAVGGFGYFGGITLLIAELGARADGEKTGALFAMQQNFLDMGLVVGSLSAGAMLQAGFSFSLIFVLSGATIALCIMVFTLRCRA